MSGRNTTMRTSGTDDARGPATSDSGDALASTVRNLDIRGAPHPAGAPTDAVREHPIFHFPFSSPASPPSHSQAGECSAGQQKEPSTPFSRPCLPPLPLSQDPSARSHPTLHHHEKSKRENKSKNNQS